MSNIFYRFELKYPVKKIILPSIEKDLLAMNFKRDEGESKEDYYYVSSIYFDTMLLSDHFDKSGGYLHRKKIRARTYDEPMDYSDKRPSIWLEIKEKYDMIVSKRRVAISPAEWDILMLSPFAAFDKIRQRLPEKERKILDEFMFLTAYERRYPHILIKYKRRAFELFSSGERVRITLDYDIGAKLGKSFSLNTTTNVSKNMAVVELKFKSTLPWQVKFILSKYGLKRDSYSKYSEGVNAVRAYYPISR